MADGQYSDQRLIPTTDMRSLYRILKEFSSIDFHLTMAREAERHRVITTIAQRFRTSIQQFSSYCNVDEPFHLDSDGSIQAGPPLCELPKQIYSSVDLDRLLIYQRNGFGQVLNHSDLDFTFVDRGIILTQTLGNAMFTDGQPVTPGKRLDWLLANQNDRRPIVAEIKVGNDMNPFYALIQTLMWASELVTFKQATRLKRHYGDQFCLPELDDTSGEFPISVDIYLILSNYDSRDEVRRELLEITQRLCERLMTKHAVSSRIRRIACLDAGLDSDHQLSFNSLFCFTGV